MGKEIEIQVPFTLNYKPTEPLARLGLKSYANVYA